MCHGDPLESGGQSRVEVGDAADCFMRSPAEQTGAGYHGDVDVVGGQSGDRLAEYASQTLRPSHDKEG
ncbi:hypothetical protein GCM10009560_13660 [Nonomuraea longicatena]|uniref:Uncharacterized protein n=1 Tax=Nonomuraea longicatena TaxID=83682 RepID=A0ABN1NV21_9ACTN